MLSVDFHEGETVGFSKKAIFLVVFGSFLIILGIVLYFEM